MYREKHLSEIIAVIVDDFTPVITIDNSGIQIIRHYINMLHYFIRPISAWTTYSAQTRIVQFPLASFEY